VCVWCVIFLCVCVFFVCVVVIGGGGGGNCFFEFVFVVGGFVGLFSPFFI
jgi:hypothetical protein